MEALTTPLKGVELKISISAVDRGRILKLVEQTGIRQGTLVRALIRIGLEIAATDPSRLLEALDRSNGPAAVEDHAALLRDIYGLGEAK